MAASALALASSPVAQITSIGAFVGTERLDVPRCYPGLLEAMNRTVQLGGQFAVLEWASWSLANGYIKAWPPQIAVLTNVTRDHLDYHASFGAYLESKGRLFQAVPRGGFVVLNADDPHAEYLASRVRNGIPILRYSTTDESTPEKQAVRIADIRVGWSGTEVTFLLREHLLDPIRIRMIGAHFAENAAAALTLALGLGLDPSASARAIGETPAPPGRFEVVADRPHVVIDFAHTANALQRTLDTARSLCKGRLIAVFGAGGNRDTGKRASMGRAATRADHIVLTSDNPRFEDPLGIIRDLRMGIPSAADVEEEPDRAAAIRRAIKRAEGEDVIVIAGRGRDTHQEVGDHWRPMDDAAIARDALTGCSG